MANLNECISAVRSVVGSRIDMDGMYGAQCVDLIKWYFKKFWNTTTWGNAIDYMSNSIPSNFGRYYKGYTNIQVGDIAIWKWSKNDIYGHIGIVVEVDGDNITSVEQNVDGNDDYLINGGAARYRTRNSTYLVGFIRPPYDNNNVVNGVASKYNIKPDKGVFVVGVDKLNVRNTPTLKGEVQAQYNNGQRINFDSYCINDGIVWISYISYSGERRFVASGYLKNGKNDWAFGEFK